MNHDDPMRPQPSWQQQPYGPPPHETSPVDQQPTTPDRRPTWGKVVVVAGLVGLLCGAVGAGATYVAVDAVDSGPVVAAPVPDGQVAGGHGENPVVGVAEATLPGVVSIDIRSSMSEVTGSGFVYDESGHVVTNNHVVANAPEDAIRVIGSDGSVMHASVVGKSPSYDLAVLKLEDASGAKPLPLGDSDQVQVGQTVVALGSPLGLESTVTSGIISAQDRPVTAGSASAASYIDALQTDASINPGNSGGPLVDLNGRVIGVNSAIASVGGATQAQAGSVGLGFAIPINQVRRTVTQIVDTGRARYPVIGASVSIRRSTGGAVVTGVSDGSPAQKVGLEAGDRITKVGGTPVADGVELIVQIRTYAPGDRLSLTYVRDGRPDTVEVTLDGQVG